MNSNLGIVVHRVNQNGDCDMGKTGVETIEYTHRGDRCELSTQEFLKQARLEQKRVDRRGDSSDHDLALDVIIQDDRESA